MTSPGFTEREDADRAELLDRLAQLEARLLAQDWIGPLLRGGLPRTEVRDTLPAASADFAYRVLTIRGNGGTTPDVTYQCLRDATGSWGWRVVSAVDANAIVGAAYSEYEEISDAAAGATNHGRVYARDNGMGKTQLVVRFPTGAVQVLATEP